jgi:hypothetical protein
MLKGRNTREYPGWHWNTNQKENATYLDEKQNGEISDIFKTSFAQDPVVLHLYIGDDDNDEV